jgi:hypothetical protein
MVYFIEIQELMDRSLLNENIDPKLILPAMKFIQDVDVGEVLGECLYEELKNQVALSRELNVDGTPAFPDAITPQNLKLLEDYIKECMIWGTMCKSIKHTTYKFWNKGMLQKTSENTQTQSYDVLDKIEKDFRDDFEIYLNKLYQYLEKNKTTYPLYSNCSKRFCDKGSIDPFINDYWSNEFNL